MTNLSNSKSLQLDKDLEMATEARTKAHLEGDTISVEATLAKDYFQTDISGRVQDRTQWLSEYFIPLARLIKSGRFRWEVWDEEVIRAQRCENVAVITGKMHLKGVGATWIGEQGWTESEHAMIGPTLIHFTRVWIKRDGKWILHALHNSIVPT